MPKRAYGQPDSGGTGEDGGAGWESVEPAPRAARPRLPVLPEPPVADGPVFGPSAELSDPSLVTRRPPGPGWRQRLRQVGGAGEGAPERVRSERRARVRRALGAPHHIAVVSVKGGVGKTTVAAAVALVLSELRGDRVAVLDADPDAGTLADRLSGESAVSVRDLAEQAGSVRALRDLDRFTSLAGRLQVLASDQDPARDDALDRAEYERAAAALARFCDVVVTDCGPGLVHPVVPGVLALAHSLVVVGSPTVDAASRTDRTLDWLAAHGHREAAARAVVVLCADRVSPQVDAARLRAHFTGRCRAVVELPHDPHLAVGGRIRTAELRPATADAVLEIAALLADEFGAAAPRRGAVPIAGIVERSDKWSE